MHMVLRLVVLAGLLFSFPAIAQNLFDKNPDEIFNDHNLRLQIGNTLQGGSLTTAVVTVSPPSTDLSFDLVAANVRDVPPPSICKLAFNGTGCDRTLILMNEFPGETFDQLFEYALGQTTKNYVLYVRPVSVRTTIWARAFRVFFPDFTFFELPASSQFVDVMPSILVLSLNKSVSPGGNITGTLAINPPAARDECVFLFSSNALIANTHNSCVTVPAGGAAQVNIPTPAGSTGQVTLTADLITPTGDLTTSQDVSVGGQRFALNLGKDGSGNTLVHIFDANTTSIDTAFQVKLGQQFPVEIAPVNADDTVGSPLVITEEIDNAQPGDILSTA